MSKDHGQLVSVLDEALEAVDQVSRSSHAELTLEEYGEAIYVGHGVARHRTAEHWLGRDRPISGRSARYGLQPGPGRGRADSA